MNATSTTSPTIEPSLTHCNQSGLSGGHDDLLFDADCARCCYWSLYWLAVPLVLVSSHLMHGVLIALHEASHGLLRKNRLK